MAFPGTKEKLSNTTATFGFVGSGTNGAGDEIWIDNVSIEKVGGEDPIPNNNITGGQNSVSEDISGLAFRFQINGSGAQIEDTNAYINGSAKVKLYKDRDDLYTLVKAGAIITNNMTIGNNLESKKLGKKGIIKVADTFFAQEVINRIAIIAPSAVIITIKDIEKALVYINENITEKIELSTLAKIANMGKTNFSITFKKVTGMTVWEYILNTRIELAANYLIEKKDKYNITEIAFMSGFNNSAHFNKTFKKLKGKTPSDFKNSHENPCFF